MANERNRLGQPGADVSLAQVYAYGVTDGNAAAQADSPAFLDDQLLLGMAWEMACEWPGKEPLAKQEEYFVAWVHGYMVRVDELESAQDTWEVIVP